MQNKKLELTTPIGPIKWFSLIEQDKFGNYGTELHLEDSPETHKLISKIDSVGEGRKPYKKQDDGSFILKIKMKASGFKRGTNEPYSVNPPAIYSSTGKKLSEEEVRKMSIGNGTEARFKVLLSAYDVNGSKGVSCKPKACQISKLVEFGGGSEGFDALEFLNEDSSDTPESSSGDSYDF